MRYMRDAAYDTGIHRLGSVGLNEEQKKGVRNICPECAKHYYAEAMTGQFPAAVQGNR